ncbi:MAG: carboxypeptidase regulatory-like domain-containing protein [Chloroflexota bacterium]
MKRSFRGRMILRAACSLIVLMLPIFSLDLQAAGAHPAILPDPQTSAVAGPFYGETAPPARLNTGLVELAARAQWTSDEWSGPLPLKYSPGTHPKGSAPELDQWVDQLLQNEFGSELMPQPSASFAGISKANGSGWPPDTNGDVDDVYYIQTVNTAIGIYNKSTGQQVSLLPFNSLFSGSGTICETSNRGDPVVVYDRFAQRWVISDFAFKYSSSGSPKGPYYECLAVSRTDDPVNGGWYLYTLKISDTQLNDYPKLGVWRDAYYLSFNMFNMPSEAWGGVQVWALEKTPLLNGSPLRYVYFTLGAGTGYGSLLPSHALSLPPAGTPNFFASVSAPNQVLVWKFLPNWSSLNQSNFTGPQTVAVAEFAAADSVPQGDSAILLDSLSPRPMMQLIYRRTNSVDALWMTHSVTNRGVAALRWYELRSPATSAALYQQGTYQPDNKHRWMGALAVDQDGNMGLGYSVSSETMNPGIRYTGRLAGEVPGQLLQGESTLVNGSGSQRSYNRWGDYSSMSIDPQDDCTFWYTTEYYAASGTNWQTRIGSFKFPSCGETKGQISGVVRNAVTLEPVPGARVKAVSGGQMMTVVSSETGAYTINLAPGLFDLTAGPLAPGYPTAGEVEDVNLQAGLTTNQDLLLQPASNLEEDGQVLLDAEPLGNHNGFPEPGESGIELTNYLENSGAITATQVTARLDSLTPLVTVSPGGSLSAYPEIRAGQQAANLSPFVFSIDPSLPCDSLIQLRKVITDSQRVYTETISLHASIPLTPYDILTNDVEGGAAGWTTGGTNNAWAITTAYANSPSHSWTDSPAGEYADNTDSYLVSPVYNLSGMRDIKVKFATRYQLEAGYDYVYLEYSTNGGSTWVGGGSSLVVLNGAQPAWELISIPAPQLDGKSSVRLRFRLISDSGVTADGIYIDDFALSYQPYMCQFGTEPVAWLPIIQR